MEESTSKDSKERKDHDLQSFKSLCNQIGVAEPDINTLFRMGKFSSERSKPRALKIVFNSKRERKTILDNTLKIRSIPERTGLNKCVVVKDLTVRQREENKIKRQQKRKAPSRNREDNTDNTSGYNNTTIMNETIPKTCPLREVMPGYHLNAISPMLAEGIDLEIDTTVMQNHNAVISPFSDLNNETVPGGIDTYAGNFLNFSAITHPDQ